MDQLSIIPTMLFNMRQWTIECQHSIKLSRYQQQSSSQSSRVINNKVPVNLYDSRVINNKVPVNLYDSRAINNKVPVNLYDSCAI